MALGDNITVLSGDDSLTLAFIASGAEGVISVASNIFPAEVTALVDAALKGDLKRASAIHRSLYPIFRDLFIEPNPVPAKLCLQHLGRYSTDRVRLPLCQITDEGRASVLESLRNVLANIDATSIANASQY